MNKGLRIVLLGLLMVAAPFAISAGVQAAEAGKITLSLHYVGVGVGFHTGEATVTLGDETGRFKVRGTHILGAGISGFDGTGTVTGASSLDDIEGKYTLTKGSIAAIAGGVSLTLKNQKGVTIHVEAQNLGVDLSIGAGTLTFTRIR